MITSEFKKDQKVVVRKHFPGYSLNDARLNHGVITDVEGMFATALMADGAKITKINIFEDAHYFGIEGQESHV